MQKEARGEINGKTPLFLADNAKSVMEKDIFILINLTWKEIY